MGGFVDKHAQGYTCLCPSFQAERPLLSVSFTPTSRFLLLGYKPGVSRGSPVLQPHLLLLSALCVSALAIMNALQFSNTPWFSLQLCLCTDMFSALQIWVIAVSCIVVVDFCTAPRHLAEMVSGVGIQPCSAYQAPCP